MNAPALLNADDFCRRSAALGQKWEKDSLTPMQLLWRGVEHGLTCTSDDPGQTAGDSVMGMACSRSLDTPQHDLLGLAEHTAAMADMIVWLLRPAGAYMHPDPISVDGERWEPASFAHARGLRRVVLCDRWSDERLLAEAHDWRTLEGAIYGLPMTMIVVVLGQSRDGRRHGPLTKGWLHPVNQDLRFQKRDGSDFGATWEPVFREKYRGTREEWHQAMLQDGVLAETIRIEEAPLLPPPTIQQLTRLAAGKLRRIREGSLPEPQLSQCDDPIRPCQFRSLCPYFREPSPENGFRLLTGSQF